jgi:hypothetical protein|eukprot:scaffold106_cov209-Alexandrium_tamarense.AAC.11
MLTKRPFVSALVATIALNNNGVVHSFAPSAQNRNNCIGSASSSLTSPTAPCTIINNNVNYKRTLATTTQVNFFNKKEVEQLSTTVEIVEDASDAELSDEKKLELILLGVWGISISAFILINNFVGPWPLFMKTVPERIFFLFHMYGGMLFAGGIILTTCIERAVAKSNNAQVLQFWFEKVPELDGLIVVPALTVSMISGTGLSIVRYGGLNIAPPHVGAIFWTLIAFMSWWAATDLTTQGTALKSVERMYEESESGVEGLVTPKVVVDRHVSNVVSCFFVLLLYSMMVLKPGTLFPFPWNS